MVPFSFGFLGEEEDCFGRVVVKLVARYFLEVESVSKLSTHVSSSVQLSFTTMGGWRGGGLGEGGATFYNIFSFLSLGSVHLVKNISTV